MAGVRKYRPRFTPSSAKNLVGVAKVIGPVLMPVITPYLVKAATAARDGLDRYRARRLGIGVAELPEFSGRGGALHVRITGVDRSLAELDSRESTSADDRAYAARARDTLTKLAAAVRAVERMPGSRRRAAHRSVGRELDPIERELLRRLGVPSRKA